MPWMERGGGFQGYGVAAYPSSSLFVPDYCWTHKQERREAMGRPTRINEDRHISNTTQHCNASHSIPCLTSRLEKVPIYAF